MARAPEVGRNVTRALGRAARIARRLRALVVTALGVCALLLSATEEFAGAERAGSATGLLMLFGNAGGVVVGVAMDLIKSGPRDWTNAIYLLLGTIVFSLLLALTTRESFHSSAAA